MREAIRLHKHENTSDGLLREGEEGLVCRGTRTLLRLGYLKYIAVSHSSSRVAT